MLTPHTANAAHNVIPNLLFLLYHTDDVAAAYLCTASAIQILKTSEEGAHFCGYRNVQMILAAQEREMGVANIKIPTISDLQIKIEDAWKAGINPHGIAQTGGIRGTRKHIDTSETEALLLSLGIPCIGSAFHGKHAWQQLLDYTEAYFSTSFDAPVKMSGSQEAHLTNKSPIFLQRPSHSLTIVGLIRFRSGKRVILTFDPAWKTPSLMRKPLSASQHRAWKLKWLLKQYTKSERYLKRYPAFETLIIERQVKASVPEKPEDSSIPV